VTYQGLINVVEVAGKDGFGWHFALLSGTGADRPWLAGNPTPLKDGGSRAAAKSYWASLI
jgi:hypothetical protein